MSCKNREDACDPVCLGWFADGETFGQVSRCDECERFAHDGAALLHAVSCEACLRVLRADAEKISLHADTVYPPKDGMERPIPREQAEAIYAKVFPTPIKEGPMQFEILQRVKIQIQNPDRWAYGLPEILNEHTGVVERYKPDYGFGKIPEPAYLVAFDPPIVRSDGPHRSPISGFWFEPGELVAV